MRIEPIAGVFLLLAITIMLIPVVIVWWNLIHDLHNWWMKKFCKKMLDKDSTRV